MIETSQNRRKSRSDPRRSLSDMALAVDIDGPCGGQLSQDAVDQLVVRAHFLALDLRVLATDPRCAHGSMTALAAEFLRHWAVECGRQQGQDLAAR